MANDSYTVKEMVTEMRTEIKSQGQNQVRMEQILEEVLHQAKKTNGRINALETEVKKIDQWKAYITGGMALAMAIGLPNLIALAQL